MSFFQRYIKDFNITGAWVRRYSSEEHNSASYNSSIKLAGYRAGLWRFKKAQKGQDLAEGEKLAPNGTSL